MKHICRLIQKLTHFNLGMENVEKDCKVFFAEIISLSIFLRDDSIFAFKQHQKMQSTLRMLEMKFIPLKYEW